MGHCYRAEHGSSPLAFGPVHSDPGVMIKCTGVEKSEEDTAGCNGVLPETPCSPLLLFVPCLVRPCRELGRIRNVVIVLSRWRIPFCRASARRFSSSASRKVSVSRAGGIRKRASTPTSSLATAAAVRGIRIIRRDIGGSRWLKRRVGRPLKTCCTSIRLPTALTILLAIKATR